MLAEKLASAATGTAAGLADGGVAGGGNVGGGGAGGGRGGGGGAGGGAVDGSVPAVHEQVFAAVTEYALGAASVLRQLFKARGLEWDRAAAGRMAGAAASQIAASVQGRGETMYSLMAADGQPNEVRRSAVRRYLQKYVERRAQKLGKDEANV